MTTPEDFKVPKAGDQSADSTPVASDPQAAKPDAKPKEIGGRGGLDPVRFGDWEKNGRCIDF